MITVLNFQNVQEVGPLKWFVSFSEEIREHLILWPIAVFFWYINFKGSIDGSINRQSVV
jgi:hypothetical protein